MKRKLLVIALTMTLMLSMAVTVFAADEITVKPDNSRGGQSYVNSDGIDVIMPNAGNMVWLELQANDWLMVDVYLAGGTFGTGFSNRGSVTIMGPWSSGYLQLLYMYEEGPFTLQLRQGSTVLATYNFIVSFSPEPPKKEQPVVYASIFTPAKTHYKDAVVYSLALRKAVNVLAVDVEFVVDNEKMTAFGFEALNGFASLEDIKWNDNGNGTSTGAVRFGYLGKPGFAAEPYEDIAKFVFLPTGVLGEANFTITKIAVTGLDENANDGAGGVVFYEVIIEEDSATTLIGNVYDLNKDGAVDLIDLGIMLLYAGYSENDLEWDTLSMTVDSLGVAIMPKNCDVTGDGEVSMADLVELLANFD